MADFNPLSQSISFKDILKSNKKQFDKMFEDQMNAAGLRRVSHRPATLEDLESGGAGNGNDGLDATNVTQFLNEKFGANWSSEVVEHNNERGMVTVLCKLSVNGSSKMQFGSARANGDLGGALQKATNEALLQCAQNFGFEDGAEGAVQEPLSGPQALSETEETPVLDKPGPAAAPAAEPVPARSKEPAAGQEAGLDTIVLDLIENALRNARHEMDVVLFRSAMSPVIREQHDEFPMITDAKGRMIVGQFGSYITEMLKDQSFDLLQGDVILQSDPFKCGGAISHINDWMVLVPVF